jgi:hypothetical protein
MVYTVRVSFGGVIALDPHVMHTCMEREREASTSLRLAPCMDAIGRAHGARGQLGLEGGEQGEDHKERGKSKRCLWATHLFFPTEMFPFPLNGINENTEFVTDLDSAQKTKLTV